MSTPANFLARWSRLKQESTAAPEAVEETAEAEAPAFDLASLPPIESIVAGSDIRPFLQLGVPENLTQAALRSAWAADPAIRDFIGIAENQWDFNDPAGIPGFGPLGAEDAERGFVSRALGQVATVAAAAAVAGPPLAAMIDPRRDNHVDKVWLSAAMPDAQTANRVDAALPQDPALDAPRPRRSHGGALPK